MDKYINKILKGEVVEQLKKLEEDILELKKNLNMLNWLIIGY